MAVLYQSGGGYLICHRSFSEQSCGRPYKRVLFDLKTPFLKDLEASSVAQTMESGVPKSRKRKRKQPEKEMPLDEPTVLNFLNELSSFFLPSPVASDFALNNKHSREAVSQFLNSTGGSKFQDINLELSDLNSTDNYLVKDILGEKIIFPPKSEFHKHDVDFLKKLVHSGSIFDLIVIDPPWTNRFVKRKRNSSSASGYRSMNNNILSTLPIPNLCSENALVAIWCTNSKNHLDYVTNILLPNWNLNYIATWFWIKPSDKILTALIDNSIIQVTVSGKFVCAWNGPSGKHPFERIILARKVTSFDENLEKGMVITDKQLIVSVPCAIHSFKPPLQSVLHPFIPKNSNGRTLEIFARSLLPNTVSCGNQLPLLQHVDLFEKVEEDEF